MIVSSRGRALSTWLRRTARPPLASRVVTAVPEVRAGARLDALGRPVADDAPGPSGRTESLGRIVGEDGSSGAGMPGVGLTESPAPPTASLPTNASGEPVLIGHSSGVSSAPLGQVRMNIEGLRDFANRDLARISAEAQALVQRFNDLPVGPGMFSQAVLPMELAHQLGAIHDILGAGLRGVVADIDRFGENVRKCADNQQRSEDDAEEALLRAVRRLERGGSEAQRAFDSAVSSRRDPAPTTAPVQPATAPAQPAAVPPPADDGGARTGTFD